jgi:hypothetical protein
LDEFSKLLIAELTLEARHAGTPLGNDFREFAVGLALYVGRTEVSEFQVTGDGRGSAAVNGVAGCTLTFIKALAMRALPKGEGAKKNDDEQDTHRKLRCRSERLEFAGSMDACRSGKIR